MWWAQSEWFMVKLLRFIWFTILNYKTGKSTFKASILPSLSLLIQFSKFILKNFVIF